MNEKIERLINEVADDIKFSIAGVGVESMSEYYELFTSRADLIEEIQAKTFNENYNDVYVDIDENLIQCGDDEFTINDFIRAVSKKVF